MSDAYSCTGAVSSEVCHRVEIWVKRLTCVELGRMF